MADGKLLRDLRERVLDESCPLEELLRLCLALGFATGSEALRSWASQELKGYSPGSVPAYRKLQLPLAAETVDVTYSEAIVDPQQRISRLHAPAEIQPLIPELVSITQPIRHVEAMAATGKNHETEVKLLPAATVLWNKILESRGESPRYRRLYYLIPDTALQGIVSVVRTTLVEMVMDLASDVPLNQLPSRHQADTAVHLHVTGSQDTYQVNVDTNTGVIGQGAGTTPIQHGPFTDT